LYLEINNKFISLFAGQ